MKEDKGEPEREHPIHTQEEISNLNRRHLARRRNVRGDLSPSIEARFAPPAEREGEGGILPRSRESKRINREDRAKRVTKKSPVCLT